MAGLSNTDLRAALDAVHDLNATSDLDDFPARALAAVRRLVPYDVAGYNEVDPRTGRIVYALDPADVWEPEASGEIFARYADQHPVLAYHAETGDGSARTISDFLTRTEYHRLDLYQELYGPEGVEYQVAVALPSPQPLVVALSMCRTDRDFSTRDCAILDLLRPHLIQAYWNADAHTRLRTSLDSVRGALGATGWGAAAAQPSGVVEPLTEDSARWLAEYDSDLASDDFAAWLREERGRPRGPDDLPDPTLAFVAHRDPRRLVVRFVPEAGGADLLLLDERAVASDPTPLTTLGLSAREAEVLLHAAEGETNEQIASALGIGTGTVKKHLASVYRKLGVRSRAAAVARAFEVLATAPRS